MSTPMVRSSGAIVTTGVATSTGPGLLSYAQASTDDTLRLYDGTSSAGVLLASIPANGAEQFIPPVQFQTGLWSVPETTTGSSAGSQGAAVAHYSG